MRLAEEIKLLSELFFVNICKKIYINNLIIDKKVIQ